MRLLRDIRVKGKDYYSNMFLLDTKEEFEERKWELMKTPFFLNPGTWKGIAESFDAGDIVLFNLGGGWFSERREDVYELYGSRWLPLRKSNLKSRRTPYMMVSRKGRGDG